jgi:hypothetical protein
VVLVRVVPEGAGGVVRWDFEDVARGFTRIHDAKDVVGFAPWRDVEPVEVEIGRLRQAID